MGIQINGQTDTISAVDGSITVATDLTVPGALTYDDVTNIDSVGIITAQAGIHVTGGLVGIGTDDPNTEFEIQSATDPKIRLQSQESGNKRLDLWIDGGEAIGYIAADQSASQLAFRTTGSERLRIDSAGRLLCGTSSGSGEPIAAFQGRSNDANDSGIVAITRTGTNPSGSIGELRFATGSDFNKYYAMVICQSDGSTTSTSLPEYFGLAQLRVEVHHQQKDFV